MLTPEEEQEMVDKMVKIFLDAFDETAERTGVPVSIVAQQFAAELEKLAADRKRLDEACAEYDPANDPDHPMYGWKPENEEFPG